MIKIYLKAISFIIFFCIFLSKISSANVNKIYKYQAKTALISMGIQNLPDIYYDHYFTFPCSIDEMCSFIENHYDYKNDSSEIWKTTVNYLKKSKSKIQIISTSTMFLITEGKKHSFNQKNICDIISSHNYQEKYLEIFKLIEFYNNDNKNIKELFGFTYSDSLKSIFKNQLKEISLNKKFENLTSLNNRFEFDKYDRILLEFIVDRGINTFCVYDDFESLNKNYVHDLEEFCVRFSKENNLRRIVFCSTIVLPERSL
jgi:hypothetical protein